MPGYDSNAQEVIKNLIQQLNGVTNAVNLTVKQVAADVAASNVSRIHNEGKAVDGSEIGEYKEGPYRKKRIKTGKEVQYVNLSFTGQLSKEFQPIKISDNEYKIGFLTQYSSQLSKYIEENYDKKIWGVSEDDKRIANETLNINIQNELKNIK